MQIKIYEINEIYQNVNDLYDDELITFEEYQKMLNEVADELHNKADNYAKMITNEKAYIEAIKNEISRLKAKITTHENKAEWLKYNLKEAMELQNDTKFETPLFKYYIRNNAPALKVNEGVILPDDFYKIKKELDKTKVKEAIKNGEEFDGVTLEASRSLIIK